MSNSAEYVSVRSGPLRCTHKSLALGARHIFIALDVHAYSLKTTCDFWRGSGKEWASGFNWAAKKVSKVIGGRTLLKYAKAVGDKVSVPIAVVGAFTLGYNASIIAQCSMGVLK